MFLLLIAYGRCVADQFGVLSSSDVACCQTEISSSCDLDSVTEHDEASCGSHHSEHEEPHDHQDPGESHHPEPEQPAPCKLCFIISNDGAILGDTIKVPAPTLLELPLFALPVTIEGIPGLSGASPLLDLTSSDQPDSPLESRVQRQRILVKLSPVRGPSVA